MIDDMTNDHDMLIDGDSHTTGQDRMEYEWTGTHYCKARATDTDLLTDSSNLQSYIRHYIFVI